MTSIFFQNGPKEDVHKEFIEKFFEEDVFPFIHTELFAEEKEFDISSEKMRSTSQSNFIAIQESH